MARGKRRTSTSLVTMHSLPSAIPCSTKVRAAYPAAFPPPTMTYLQINEQRGEIRSSGGLGTLQIEGGGGGGGGGEVVGMWFSLPVLIGETGGRRHREAPPEGRRAQMRTGGRVDAPEGRRLRAPEGDSVPQGGSSRCGCHRQQPPNCFDQRVQKSKRVCGTRSKTGTHVDRRGSVSSQLLRRARTPPKVYTDHRSLHRLQGGGNSRDAGVGSKRDGSGPAGAIIFSLSCLIRRGRRSSAALSAAEGSCDPPRRRRDGDGQKGGRERAPNQQEEILPRSRPATTWRGRGTPPPPPPGWAPSRSGVQMGPPRVPPSAWYHGLNTLRHRFQMPPRSWQACPVERMCTELALPSIKMMPQEVIIQSDYYIYTYNSWLNAIFREHWAFLRIPIPSSWSSSQSGACWPSCSWRDWRASSDREREGDSKTPAVLADYYP